LVPTHQHVQIYLSDYTLNGLYWAFYQDGRLSSTVTPTDPVVQPDPDVLKVKTYVSAVPSLAPYRLKDMNAIIDPQATPTLSFQTIYLVNQATLDKVRNQLPADVYAHLDDLAGNAYVALSDFQADLAGEDIPQQYFAAIAAAAQLDGA